MKIFFLGVLLFLASTNTFADTFSYDCHLTTDSLHKIKFDLNPEQMKLYGQYILESTKPFKVRRGWAILVNRGEYGGKGKMKSRLYFTVDYDKSQVVSENTNFYYVERELTTGGRKMRNGRLGGFISFTGEGYGYESYVCYRH